MATAFKIIKNAPKPAARASYPFPQMEVGDAFDAPIAERGKISSAVIAWSAGRGTKFTVRKISEKTLRIWRVA